MTTPIELAKRRKTNGQTGDKTEPDRTKMAAFRVTPAEQRILRRYAKVHEHPLSDVLRSFFSAIIVRGKPLLQEVAFSGGYCARNTGVDGTWQVIKDGVVIEGNLAPAEAIIQAEWRALARAQET